MQYLAPALVETAWSAIEFVASISHAMNRAVETKMLSYCANLY